MKEKHYCPTCGLVRVAMPYLLCHTCMGDLAFVRFSQRQKLLPPDAIELLMFMRKTVEKYREKN